MKTTFTVAEFTYTLHFSNGSFYTENNHGEKNCKGDAADMKEAVRKASGSLWNYHAAL
jgi:hypothetical protein